jgi:hypothetical protein
MVEMVDDQTRSMACLKGAGWWSGNPACLWIPGLTGLGGTVEQNRDCVCGGVPGLEALRGTALQSEYCAVVCRLWGHDQQSRDHVQLGSAAQQDIAPAVLCRPWEPGRQSRDHAGLGSAAQ